MKLKLISTLVVILVACQFVQAAELGIKKGIRTGINIGLNRGVNRGVNTGIRNGVGKGVRNGLRHGLKHGFKTGVNNGIQNGLRNGARRGVRKGARRGAKIGVRKAAQLGARRGVYFGALPGVYTGFRRGARKGARTGARKGMQLASYFGVDKDSGSLPGVSLQELPGYYSNLNVNKPSERPTLPIHDNNYQLPHDTAVDFTSELQPVEDDIAAINGTLNGGAYDSMENIEIPVNIKGSKNTDTLTINQRSAENEESPIGCLHGTFPKLVNNKWKCVRKSEYENHVFDFQARWPWPVSVIKTQNNPQQPTATQ